MKQKWPILIFSALLTAFIVLAGIWGNAQFQQLPSGGCKRRVQLRSGIHCVRGFPQQIHRTCSVITAG